MSEVQAEEVVEEPQEIEAPEIPEGFVPVDKHQKDINVKVKKWKEEERARVREQERADALQSELDKLKNVEVVVPPVPDPYSETYKSDLEKRDEAVRAQTKQELEASRAESERKKQEDARRQEEQQALDANLAKFNSRIVEQGFDPFELKQAADTVIAYGISNQFQDVLVEHEDGPALVKYLAENQAELEELSHLSVLSLVNKLSGDIRQRASLLKPKTSDAPDPPITLSGGGAPEVPEPWEKGVKYE